MEDDLLPGLILKVHFKVTEVVISRLLYTNVNIIMIFFWTNALHCAVFPFNCPISNQILCSGSISYILFLSWHIHLLHITTCFTILYYSLGCSLNAQPVAHIAGFHWQKVKWKWRCWWWLLYLPVRRLESWVWWVSRFYHIAVLYHNQSVSNLLYHLR